MVASVPIQVHPKNSRYFLWQNEAICVVSSGEHYGAVLNLDFDYERYLKTLHAEGMRYTRIFTGAYVEPAGAFGIERNTLAPQPERIVFPWQRSEAPGTFEFGDRLDLTQWNNAYLERLKSFVSLASHLGIIVEVTLFSSVYGEAQWKVNPFNPANTVTPLDCTNWKQLHILDGGTTMAQQVRLTRYLVRELNDFDNVVYEIQNEPWADHYELGEIINPYLYQKMNFPNRVEITIAPSVAWQRKIAQAIREEESRLAKTHLILQSICNFRLAIHPEIDLSVDVDAVHFHYAHPEAVEWNESLKKPIGCDETGFAGTADDVYRKQAWSFVMAGGSLWNHLDYSFAVGYENGTDRQSNSPGGGGPKLRRQLRVLSDFINGFDLVTLAPNRNSVTNSFGTHARCLATFGKQYAIYLTGRAPSSVTLSLPNGNYTGEWIDVTSGAILQSIRINVSTKSVSLESPQFNEEIALRILVTD